MGDKNPKSTRKQASQKQAKADDVKRKKKDAEVARQSAFTKK
jgi:hypothetical protein